MPNTETVAIELPVSPGRQRGVAEVHSVAETTATPPPLLTNVPLDGDGAHRTDPTVEVASSPSVDAAVSVTVPDEGPGAPARDSDEICVLEDVGDRENEHAHGGWGRWLPWRWWGAAGSTLGSADNVPLAPPRPPPPPPFFMSARTTRARTRTHIAISDVEAAGLRLIRGTSIPDALAQSCINADDRRSRPLRDGKRGAPPLHLLFRGVNFREASDEPNVEGSPPEAPASCIFAVHAALQILMYERCIGMCALPRVLPMDSLPRSYVPFARLVSISWVSCPDLDDAGIVYMARHLPALTTVRIAGCARVTTVGVVDALAAAAHHAHGIQNLFLDACPQLDARVLDGFVHSDVARRALRYVQLRRLGREVMAGGDGRRAHCWFAPHATRLSFADSPHCTSAFVRRVLDPTWGSRLAVTLWRVDLSHCSQVSAALLAELRALRALRELSLRGCTGVGPAELAEIVAHHPHMEALNLDGCSGVATDDVRGLILAPDASWESAAHLVNALQTKTDALAERADDARPDANQGDSAELMEVLRKRCTLLATALSLPCLQSLSLRRCVDVDGETVQHYAKLYGDGFKLVLS